MEILKEIIAADKAAAARVEALRAQQENSLAESGRAVKDIFDAHRGEWISEIMQNITGV